MFRCPAWLVLCMKRLEKKVAQHKIEKFNKDVIAALSGKRKVVLRPMRSVRYNAMAMIPCPKCDTVFPNESKME